MSVAQTTHAPINGIAAGWALSAVLLILFLACVVLASLWPTSAFGQGWQTVLATLPGGSLAAFIETLLGLIAIAWLVVIVYVGVYNRLLPRR
jgi:hypothetical protein